MISTGLHKRGNGECVVRRMVQLVRLLIHRVRRRRLTSTFGLARPIDEDALWRVHNAAQERFEHEYVQREQGAYALAKEERERELMSQYGRELKAGVEAGQRREQECLQALFNTELARDQDVE